MIRKMLQALLALSLLLSFDASAAPTAPLKLPGVEVGPSLGGISEYRFSNGFKVLLMPDPARDKITLNITYLVGSRHEGYGERGMAHLLEHMLFKGTPRIPDAKGELVKHGAQSNGTTYYDRTNYYETFAANDGTLAALIAFEADRMINARVAKSDLDSEMTVVRSEFERGENDPQDLLDTRINGIAYLWHNYGRDVIGTRSDIENVPIERLQAFYKHFYQPDNAVLVIAGRFDPARALKAVKQSFGSIPKPKRTLFPTYTREPPQDGERELVMRRVGDVQIAQAQYHIPPGSHRDFVAVDMATQILTMQPNGRLHRKLVESGLAASIYGYEVQLREPGTVRFGVKVPTTLSLTTASDAMVATVEGFEQEPVTAEEVERARTKLIKEVDLYLPDTNRVAVGLSEFIAMGDWRLLFWYRDLLTQTTQTDVQRVATTFFKRANRSVGLFYPTATPELVPTPEAPDLQKSLADFKPAQELALGESFDASPQNIEARLIRRTLPSGMKLVMLPKKTRGGTVVAGLNFHWGNEESKSNRRASCTFAGIMLSRGTELRTRAELRDALDRLRANVSVSAESASVSTIGESLPDSLRLIAEMLRKPSFPAQEFEQAKRELVTGLEAKRNDPSALVTIRLNRHLNPYPPEHWNYTPTVDEDIARINAVTLEEARTCHAQMGASHSELAVVGDFDPEVIAKLAEELFGDWKTPGTYVRIPARHDEVPAIKELIAAPDKANAEVEAGLNIPMRDDHVDFPAMVLGNYLLGGNWDARLWKRVREKEGLSYSVGSWFDAASLDPAGVFGMQAIFAPQNRERVEQALRDELSRALDQGYTQAEVEKARANYLKARALSRNSDNQLLSRLLKYAFIDRDFKWDIEFERRLAAMTPAEIREAMRKHIQAEKLSFVAGGDFK
ncbi:MAG TPA: pitrilysin family protein [Burkholderiales bacterium]|nr:pitrilysin family protein [Burkholderiales bacterium]